MDRDRDLGMCPTCNQEPKVDDHGRLACNCAGVFWSFKKGTIGSPEDQELLMQNGWQLVELSRDVYWVGPYGNILYLHDDGTWHCDTAPREYSKLSDYLEWYSGKLDGISAPTRPGGGGRRGVART